MKKEQMREKNKTTKGITLIALVVTIIILVILATVSVNLVLNEGGLIKRTEIAKEIYENNAKKELEDMKNLEDEIKKHTEIANMPDISGFNTENTYFVTWTWDENTNTYKINDTTSIKENEVNDWYDYSSSTKHWANIKTTGGDNICYWVWIPRYAYKVPTKGSKAETIEVKFLKDKTNYTIENNEEITNTEPKEGKWVVHPAFTNSGNGGLGELSGIWVAKYEASSNSQLVVENPTEDQLNIDGGAENNLSLKIRIRPNVVSWRNISLGNIITVCKNLTSESNSLENTKNIDSHLMKNTEWGAVAYLSRSIYGKNSQVYNNPYYSDSSICATITGLCGNDPDYATTTYNDENVYKYNTEKGKNASTTGNVYGIYDMAGGSWEYVAAVLDGATSNNDYDFSNIDKKYYESYEKYGIEKYGDAVYETSEDSKGKTSWDLDYSLFVYKSNPVFVRGGRSYIEDSAGIFAFSIQNGSKNMAESFRPCLTCK